VREFLIEILKNYAKATGHAPIMPKKLLGLWQSKLRYRTPEEVFNNPKSARTRDFLGHITAH